MIIPININRFHWALNLISVFITDADILSQFYDPLDDASNYARLQEEWDSKIAPTMRKMVQF